MKKLSLPLPDIVSLSLKPYAHDGVDFVVVCLCVNNEPLANFSYYAIDLEELVRGQSEAGEVFLVTCWCGEPSCAGIYRGIQVTHDGDKIYWSVPEPLTPKKYVLERTALDAALSALRKEIKAFVAERTYSNKAAYEIVPMENEPFFSLG